MSLLSKLWNSALGKLSHVNIAAPKNGVASLSDENKNGNVFVKDLLFRWVILYNIQTTVQGRT